MKRSVLCLLAALLSCARPQPQRESASAELAELYRADQADRTAPLERMSGAASDTIIRTTLGRDSSRRVRVAELIAEKRLQTADDFFHAGMIVLHRHDTLAYHDAVRLATQGLAIDSLHQGAGFLAATASDNLRRSRGEATWYGMHVRGGLREPPRMMPFDSTRVTDAERVRLGMEPIAQQRVRLEAMVREWRPPQRP